MAPDRRFEPALQPGQFHAGGVHVDGRHALSLLFREVLFDELRFDALELSLGQNAQQLPAQIQRLLDGPVGLVALGDIALFKLIRKLGVLEIGGRQSGLAQDAHQLLVLLTGG